MKTLISLTLMLIMAASLQAKPCDCELIKFLPELIVYYENAAKTETSSEPLYEHVTLADATYVAMPYYWLQQELQLRPLTKKDVEGVRNKLCYQTDSARVSGFRKDVFEKPILEIYKISANDRNKNQIISQFLNTYKNDLICIKQQDSDIKRNVHVYKYALFRSIIDMFDELLLDEDNYTIDFNAYEIVDGKKETVVDYIDKLIAEGLHNKGEMLSIRAAIVQLGGKKGSEL